MSNNKMKITAEDQYNMARKANRDIEIAQGRINFKRVHKSKKSYDRKESKKFDWAE